MSKSVRARPSPCCPASADGLTAYSVLTDLICSLLPGLVLVKLQIPLRLKFLLCGLTSLGLMCVGIEITDSLARANIAAERPCVRLSERRHWERAPLTCLVRLPLSLFACDPEANWFDCRGILHRFDLGKVSPVQSHASRFQASCFLWVNALTTCVVRNSTSGSSQRTQRAVDPSTDISGMGVSHQIHHRTRSPSGDLDPGTSRPREGPRCVLMTAVSR
jgi:hypothetical protein